MSTISGDESKLGVVSEGNSSKTNLLAGASFTGEWFDATNYAQATYIVNTDQTGTLHMQVSMDGVQVDKDKQVDVSSTSGVHSLVITARFYRTLYVNGGVNTGTFRISTLFHKSKSKGLTSTLDQTVTNSSDVALTRSILVAERQDQTYGNIRSSQDDSLMVSLSGQQLTAFGEVKTSKSTPVINELFGYSINPRIWESILVGSGTISEANSMAWIGSGTTTGSTAIMESIKRARYRPGLGLLCRFTSIFSAPVVGTTQWIGLSDVADGFSFGYNSAGVFGILHRNSASGSLVETFIPQSTWDEDPADGSKALPNVDWQKGQVCGVQMQYLGMGSIRFYVELSHPGNFILVHSIDYANTATVPSLSNSILPFCTSVDNGATTSDIIIKSSSVGIFVEGDIIVHGLTNALANDKAGVSSTPTNILTIKSTTTYHGRPNHIETFPKLLNVSTDGNKSAVVSLRLNVVLGGTPSYTDVNTLQSIISYDTAGTTVTNGQTLFTVVMGKVDSKSFDLSSLELFMRPGDTLTIEAHTTSGTSDISCSLTWVEDL